jgi:RimJ/RimL family protein N-acetyltransferase
MFELDYNLDAAYGYVQSQQPGLCRVEGSAGFCMRRHGKAIAGAVFYDYNGRSMWVHTAGSPGGHWLNRRFLQAYLSYPFLTCGVSCLRGFVHEGNQPMLRLIAHLGGVIEARLQGAAPDGGDVVIAALWKEKLTYGPLA